MEIPVVVDDLDDQADVFDVLCRNVEDQRLVVHGIQSRLFHGSLLLLNPLILAQQVNLDVRI